MTACSDPATSFLTPTPIWQGACGAGLGGQHGSLPGCYVPTYVPLQLTWITCQTAFLEAGSADHWLFLRLACALWRQLILGTLSVPCSVLSMKKSVSCLLRGLVRQKRLWLLVCGWENWDGSGLLDMPSITKPGEEPWFKDIPDIPSFITTRLHWNS